MENDKIIVISSGQILTVHVDLSDTLSPGIVVKEVGVGMLRREDVGPAGKTREQWDKVRNKTGDLLRPTPPLQRKDRA